MPTETKEPMNCDGIPIKPAVLHAVLRAVTEQVIIIGFKEDNHELHISACCGDCHMSGSIQCDTERMPETMKNKSWRISPDSLRKFLDILPDGELQREREHDVNREAYHEKKRDWNFADVFDLWLFFYEDAVEFDLGIDEYGTGDFNVKLPATMGAWPA